MTKEKCLLDILQKCIGLEYISDLQAYPKYSQIAAIIELIPAERYPLSVWADAARYITGSDSEFTTAEDARAFLLSHKH